MLKVEKTLLITDFPSGSSLEFYNNKIYLIGDDATQLLVLDPGYNRVDSLPLFESNDQRIEKDKKVDLESSAIITVKGKPHFLLLGSASAIKREKLLLFPITGVWPPKVQTINTSKFNKLVSGAGVKDINYEGLATIKNAVVISNRGNLQNPVNHLIFTSIPFWIKSGGKLNVAQLTLKNIKGGFTGVSGLVYNKATDQLLFTASTEETNNSYDDGEIKDSYIGWINNISKKTAYKNIHVNGMINLDEVNPEFKGQKIESLCVESTKKNVMTLHLVADNDNGQSKLFKVKLTL